MQEYQAESLSKYIEIIENLKNDKILYRGENQLFNNRISKALREYDSSFYGNNTEQFPFEKIIYEFYRETSNTINENDKKNFLAFAQHYGVPTNLIDITESPLVALYFACIETKEVKEKVDDIGYVYFFDDKHIDITDIVQNPSNLNLIEKFFLDENNEYLYNIFYDFRINNYDYLLELLKKLIDEYFNYFYRYKIDDKYKRAIEEIKRTINNIQEETDYFIVLRDFEELEDFLIDDNFVVKDILTTLFLKCCNLFFTKAKEHREPMYWVNFLPRLMYRPILSFARGKQQGSLFYYQSYLSYLDKYMPGPYRTLMIQRINYDGVIKIENKSEILNLLDKVGINKKTLFCDYDSIADYYTAKIKARYNEQNSLKK